MSAVAKTSKYTYRSSGGGTTDVNIEYTADLSALSRLEVQPLDDQCSAVTVPADTIMLYFSGQDPSPP